MNSTAHVEEEVHGKVRPKRKLKRTRRPRTRNEWLRVVASLDKLMAKRASPEIPKTSKTLIGRNAVEALNAAYAATLRYYTAILGGRGRDPMAQQKISRLWQKAGRLKGGKAEGPEAADCFLSAFSPCSLQVQSGSRLYVQSRLKDANEILAMIAHEINNPLIVIRLALFHLENPEMTKSRRIALFRMLSENVDRVDTQVEQLRHVRRILGDGSAALFDRATMSPQEQKAV